MIIIFFKYNEKKIGTSPPLISPIKSRVTCATLPLHTVCLGPVEIAHKRPTDRGRVHATVHFRRVFGRAGRNRAAVKPVALSAGGPGTFLRS